MSVATQAAARRKRTYHTGYMLLHQAGGLPASVRAGIPRSTLCGWKTRDAGHIVGADPDHPFTPIANLALAAHSDAKLRKTLAAVWLVYRLLRATTVGLRGYNAALRERKGQVVELVRKVRPALGLTRVVRMLDISSTRFHAWADGCRDSPMGLCRRRHPGQLSAGEARAIVNAVKAPDRERWPRISVFYRMMEEGAAFMGRSTFYNYANELVPAPPRIRKERYRSGIRAERPFQILHMDLTLLRTLDHVRVYVHFIIDNFSRAILGWRAALSWKSVDTAAHIRDVCQRWGLFGKPLHLWCDGGSENKGAVTELLLEPDMEIERVVAQVDVVFSNSMVEASFKMAKYQLLFPAKPANFAAVPRILEAGVPAFNARPHGQLGASPMDVLQGKVLPDRNRFHDRIVAAARARVAVNGAAPCGRRAVPPVACGPLLIEG
jgi:hypothetical protein